MSNLIGWKEATTGERESQEFMVRAGGVYVVITDIPNSTPDWDFQIQMPDGTWLKASGSQVDQSNPLRAYNCPPGPCRMRCDTSTTSHFSPVKIYWKDRATFSEYLLHS